jgi:hypothetical protein
LFGKLTYEDYFCESEIEQEQNPFATATEDIDNNSDDVEELFKATQEIIDKKKKVKFKKRRSYAVRMSATKNTGSKNTSNESPISQGGSNIGLKIPRLGGRKKKSNVPTLKRFVSNTSEFLQPDGLKAGDNIMRQSVGIEQFDEDYFSFINSLKKTRKKF